MKNDTIAIEVLKRALEKSWTQKTSADPKNWNKENPQWGQCAVTALVVQDLFGGKIYRLDLAFADDLKVRLMRSHYFNSTENQLIDLTADQFQNNNDEYYIQSIQMPERILLSSRERLLSNSETKSRYLRLKLDVDRYLSRVPKK
ncbi:MAG: hypothetical protein WCW87_00125 [Candidatus Paceibacterota bacterium]